MRYFLLLVISFSCASFLCAMDVDSQQLKKIIKKNKYQEPLTESEATILINHYNELLESGSIIITVHPSCASNESGTTKKPRKKKAHCSVQ